MSRAGFFKILRLFHPSFQTKALHQMKSASKRRDNVEQFAPRYPLISKLFVLLFVCFTKQMKSKTKSFDFLKVLHLKVKQRAKQTKHFKKSSSDEYFGKGIHPSSRIDCWQSRHANVPVAFRWRRLRLEKHPGYLLIF